MYFKLIWTFQQGGLHNRNAKQTFQSTKDKAAKAWLLPAQDTMENGQ